MAERINGTSAYGVVILRTKECAKCEHKLASVAHGGIEEMIGRKPGNNWPSNTEAFREPRLYSRERNQEGV